MQHALRGEDTIVAVATPPGASSCAVLRLSGGGAIGAASRLFGGEGRLAGAPSFTVVAAALDFAGVEAPARAVVFRGPRSYTREDMVEITLPGVPPLVGWVLSTLLAAEGPAGPVRMAHPGEFTLRAFRSGRIDLTQAEAVASLIGAASEAERRAADRQLRGELRSRVSGIGGEVMAALALVEAALDFPDEDLPFAGTGPLTGNWPVESRVLAALAAIGELRSSSALRLPDTGALRAVLAGFPNAGKSSLLNALLGRPAAIVADLAGTTRDPVRGQALRPGRRAIEWIDLAGFQVPPPDAAGPSSGWPEGEEDLARAVSRLTRRELESADVVVWVVDAALPEVWERSLSAFRALEAPRKVLALNKADLLGADDLAPLRSRPERPVLVSALRSRGLEELCRRVGEGGEEKEAPQFLITARQAGALDRAGIACRRALESLRGGEGQELAAVDLREALSALDELTGRELAEKVLAAIFEQFCIGK